MSDGRRDLLDLLREYRPLDRHDRLQKEKIETFVRDHFDCFERSNVKGHVTGSAWIVDHAGRRVLLTHHKKLNKWLQLGGHSDGNPNLLQVALREAWEESGLEGLTPLSPHIFDLDVHSIPPREGEPGHYHYDIRFAFRAPAGKELIISEESHQLSWVPLDDLSQYSDEESLHRMARKWDRLAAGNSVTVS